MQDAQIQRLWQSELAISREDAKQTRYQLAEAKRQLEALKSRNAQLEAERNGQNDMIAKTLTALRMEVNNPLFSISGSAESALNRLATLHELGCSDTEELAPRLKCILEGAERIRQIVAVPTSMHRPG